MRLPRRSLALPAAALLVLAGCSTPPPATHSSTSGAPSASSTTPGPDLTTAPNVVTPTGRAGSPRGGLPSRVKGSSPDAVAAAVAATVWTWDTAIDATPQDAARRAAVWMTPAEASTTLRARPAGGGAVWNTLAAARGWTSATTRRDTEPPPPIQAGQTARRVFVTVTFHGAHLATEEWAVAMTLTRSPAGAWQVSAVVSAPESS